MYETNWYSNLLDSVVNLNLVNDIQFIDIALLLARTVLAVVLLVSFYNKIGDIKGFAKQNRLPLIAGYFQVFIEGLAGAILLTGMFTQFGALLVMIAMSGSMYFHVFKWKSKYWASSGGWEYDLMIFSLASIILLIGGGLIGVYPSPESGWLPFLNSNSFIF